MPAELRRAFAVALPAWFVSRALAGAALLLAWLRHGHALPVSGHGAPGATGIWAWDAAWYRSIAEFGYGGQVNPHGERFFPLMPLLGRWLGTVLGGSDGLALVLVANLAALGFAAGIALLAARELPGTEVGATWLTMLAPGAVVLTVAYAEPLAGLLAVTFLLTVRAGGRWAWWAVPVGMLAGLARPTGLLLAVVPLVELLLRHRSGTRTGRAPLAAAAAAPIAGTAVYCLWTAAVDGKLLLPFSAQNAPGLRGGVLANPLHGLLLAPNHHGLPAAVRVAAALLALALLVVAWRVLPASIAAWATLLFVAAVTSAQGTSLPRYLSGDFPLLLALAFVLRDARRQALGIAVCAVGFLVVGASGFGAGMVF